MGCKQDFMKLILVKHLLISRDVYLSILHSRLEIKKRPPQSSQISLGVYLYKKKNKK